MRHGLQEIGCSNVFVTRHTRSFALIGILLLTAALWAGVSRIGLNSDDFEYIPTLAPIAHVGDLFRPFVTQDMNPSYFRPVANLTMSLDFLLFGWSGEAFHLTNLLLHLIATLLVFCIARNIFRMSAGESLAASLAFGLLASHEYNLVVDTARADILAAIFVMLALLTYGRWRNIPSLICFASALLSKEIAVLILPFLPFLWWKKGTNKSWPVQILPVAPYLALLIAFFFYHSHFTTPILASQPLTASGAHSAIAFLRNGVYSLAYFVLPLELEQATSLLANYRTTALLLGMVAILLFTWFLVSRMHRELVHILVRPATFSFLTGSILFLTFERWRLYLPSIGLIAIMVLVVNRLFSRNAKRIALLLLIPLAAFHVYRALAVESSWRESTALRNSLRNDLTQILSQVHVRPLTLGILTSPAKLGSASVILLGEEAFVTRAEADRLDEFNRQTGSVHGTQVDSWTAVDVYALDGAGGFRPLSIGTLGRDRYLISVPAKSAMILYPSSIPGSERRDLELHTGDSVSTLSYTDIVRTSHTGLASSIEVDVHDTSALLLGIDSSERFRRIR